MINEGMFTSNSTDWETPPEVFQPLLNEFGFTLDPCCTDKTAKCYFHFTEKEDGLSQSWEGHTVFVNPPYGRDLKKWVKKSAAEAATGTTIVMLIPARTDTHYFHDYIYGKAEIRFPRGRIKFLDNGVAKGGAPFPSMVVVFRKNWWQKLMIWVSKR